MVESLSMLLRLKNVNDLVNQKINVIKDNKKIDMNNIDISNWNWIVKGKMHGTEKFTNLYNILSNKMKIHNMSSIIISENG